jgi:hypothetical protein
MAPSINLGTTDAATALIRSLMFLCRNDLTYKLQYYSLNYYIVGYIYVSSHVAKEVRLFPQQNHLINAKHFLHCVWRSLFLFFGNNKEFL